MPSSKKSMSKTRQLSALVNFVSCLRANRTKARTRAFMRWRLNLEASRAAAARARIWDERRSAAATARGQRLACVVIASSVLKSWRRSAFRRWRRPRRISLDRPTKVSVESPKAIEYRPAEGDRSPTTPVTPPRALVTWSAPATPSTPLRDRAADRGFNRIASPAENREEAAAAARIAQVGRKIQRLFDAYGDQGLMNQYSFGLMAVDCALVPTLTEDVDEVIAVLGPKEELDFEDFCLALARVGLAHGAGKVSGEPDAIRALIVVIASSDGFGQAQRTPSRKSLRDFSPPSPMAALQL